MAGEVVGTAYVRIKALTKGLAKDIEKSVKKGMKDANLEKAGEDGGKRLGTSFGDSTVDSASERIKERSGDLISDDVFDDLRDKIKSNGGLLGDMDLFPEGTEDRFRDSLRGQSNFLDSHLDDINANIEAKWPKDRDLLPGMGDTRRRTERDGNAIGDALGKLKKKILDFETPGFGGVLTKALGGIAGLAVAALPYIQDIGAGILAYATGIVAQIGGVVTALGGLGAAAGAAGVAALLPLFPIMLAFKAESDILTEFKDSMVAAKDEFMEIGLAAQRTLLPSLDEAIFILGDLIPLFAEYGEVVGEIAGDYALLAANTLTGEKAQGRFQSILEASLSIFEKFLAIIINVGDILSGIFVAALPVAIRFSDSLLDLVTRWAALVNFNLNSGHLTETLEIWYDRAETLMGALGNLSGALFDILQVGADSSDSVFERFAVWAEEYRAWTESELGQNKLRLIFDNALTVMREVNGVIAELFSGVGRLDEAGGVDGLVSALQTLRDLIPGIKDTWEDLYDGIKVVVEYFLDKASRVFNDLEEDLRELAESLRELLDTMADTNSLTVFIDLMTGLLNVLDTLLNLPGLGTFLAYMLAFGSAFKIAVLVLGPFIALLKPLAIVLGIVVKVFAGAFLILSGITGIGPAIAILVGVVAAAVAIFKNWDVVVRALNIAWDALWEAVLALGRFLKDPMSRITQLKENLEDLAGSLGGVLLNALSTAGGALLDFGGKIASAIGDALSALPGIIGRALSALPEILGKAALFAIEAFVTVVVGAFLALPAAIYLLVTKVGPVLITAFTEAFNFLVQYLPVAFAAVLNFFQNLPGQVLGALDALIDTVFEFASKIPGLITTGLSAMSDIGTVIGDALSGAAGAVGRFLSKIPGAIARFATRLPKLFGKAMTAVFGAVSDGFGNVFGIFGDFPGKAMEVLSELPGAMVDGIKALPGMLADALSAAGEFAFEALRATIHRVLQGVLILIFGIPFLIFQGLLILGPKLVEIFSGAFEFLVGALSGLITAVIQFFIDLPGKIIGALVNLGSTLGSYITDVAWPFVTTAVSDAIDGTIQFFKDLPGNLKDAVVSAWDTFWLYWNEIGWAIKQFIRDRIDDVIQFFSDLPGNIKDAVVSAWNTFWSYYTGLGYEMRKFIGDRISDIVGFFSGLPGRITTALAGLGATLLGIGQTVIGKLLEGLGAAPGRIADLAGKMLDAVRGLGKSLINGVIDALNNLLPNEIGEVKVRGITILPGINLPDNPIPRLSKGGFVGMSGMFGSGPLGTDTIPAWLTPGEFVLRRSVAQSIPAGTLRALNDGNPRLISMLSSISRGRPGTAGASLADITAATSRGTAGGPAFGPNSVVIYAQGTSAREVYNEFDHRVNWKLTSRGDR